MKVDPDLSARAVISDIAVKFAHVKSLLKILEIAMLSGMQKPKSPKEHPCSIFENFMAKQKYARNDC